MTDTSLENRVAIVTGASSGVGEATVRALARAGAGVTAVARSVEGMAGLAGEGAVEIVGADVRSLADMELAAQATLDRFGRIDTIVANAGIGEYADFLDQTPESARDIVETNFLGTVWSIRAALPHLLAAGRGDIVVVSSVAAVMDSAGEAVYAATKAAQKSLAGCLDLELRQHNIRVTTLCPGGIRTRFAIGRGREEGSAEMDTMLDAEDVAAAILTVLTQPATVRTTVWGMSHLAEE
ncbi:MAG TPA: SDR family NAD(P)-dependent oxidoreductase [Solirubrobacteraceae bacterium]|nr:SDR family NAD(P)-dependent oxidoreductase [Solirubrobacteraceae bacterium]